MENLSDGIKNGFVLLYLKDKKLQSVALSEEQANTLDIILKTIFGNNPAQVVPANDLKKYIE